MSRPLHEIQQDLSKAIQLQAEPMLSLDVLEKSVARATAQATLDPTKKADLLFAVEAFEKEQKRQLDQPNRNRAVAMLRQELDMANNEERMARIADANARVDTLQREFIGSAKQLCRLYEQLLKANTHMAASVPGYQHRTLPTFDFPFMLPMGWNGRTSEMISDGSLHWLNKEKEQ